MYDGTIHLRPDGRYELQITVGRRNNGKRIRKSFYGKREREVIAKKDEWLKNNYIDPRSKENLLENTEAFSVWADKWLAMKKSTVREYTYENTYRTRVEKYLKPYFRYKPLKAISQSDVQKFFMEHADLSLALQKTLKTILNNMFKLAALNDLCSRNPVIDIKLRSNHRAREKDYLTVEQQEMAIKWAIHNEQYDVLTVLKSGIRRGELLGLYWDDINFSQKYIHICRSMCDSVEQGGEPDMELKSCSSNRIIPVDDELLRYLGELPHTEERIFPYCTAKAYGAHICRVLKRMAKECGFPYVTLHGLRHTYGTVLKAKGVDIYTIQKLLGHSSVDVTAKIYVHNELETLRKAMKI